MTDPSKGLLPQLVDLLRALADSQELLTDRIRRAHLEFLGVDPLTGDDLRQAAPIETERPAGYPLVASDSTEAPDIRELFSPDQVALSIGTSRTPSDSNSNLAAEDVSVNLNGREGATLPSNSSAASTTSAHEPGDPLKAPPKQPDDLTTTPQNQAPIEPGYHGYNYFDELDARLTDLGNSENGSNEHGS